MKKPLRALTEMIRLIGLPLLLPLTYPTRRKTHHLGTVAAHHSHLHRPFVLPLSSFQLEGFYDIPKSDLPLKAVLGLCVVEHDRAGGKSVEGTDGKAVLAWAYWRGTLRASLLLPIQYPERIAADSIGAPGRITPLSTHPEHTWPAGLADVQNVYGMQPPDFGAMAHIPIQMIVGGDLLH